jgi:Mg/Co/Ni transporter MgtE
MSRQQAKDKKKLIERLAKTPIVEVACKQADLPRTTYYRWRKEDQQFALACDEAIEQSAALINDLAESQLIAAIKDKNITAILYWLKHRHPAYASRLELSGTLKHEAEALNPEQEALVLKALELAQLYKPNPEADNGQVAG